MTWSDPSVVRCREIRVTALLALALATLAAGAVPTSAQAKVEKNVVYGMYSGLALLMDVYHPERSNGIGIIQVSGSAWTRALGYEAVGVKEGYTVGIEVPPLVKAGYTVFSVNHRATPRFQYPAPVEDVQRAVRFIRHNAGEYGIDAERIGAVGGSSGGYLVSMLGVLDGRGDPKSDSPIDRQSARVQAVIARATPHDLLLELPEGPVAKFMGALKTGDPTSAEYRRYREASPINYVSADDPPFLLVHGDADRSIPFPQSERFLAALRTAGMTGELVRIPGGTHQTHFGTPDREALFVGEMVRWFDTHLRK